MKPPSWIFVLLFTLQVSAQRDRLDSIKHHCNKRADVGLVPPQILASAASEGHFSKMDFILNAGRHIWSVHLRDVSRLPTLLTENDFNGKVALRMADLLTSNPHSCCPSLDPIDDMSPPQLSSMYRIKSHGHTFHYNFTHYQVGRKVFHDLQMNTDFDAPERFSIEDLPYEERDNEELKRTRSKFLLTPTPDDKSPEFMCKLKDTLGQDGYPDGGSLFCWTLDNDGNVDQSLNREILYRKPNPWLSSPHFSEDIFQYHSPVSEIDNWLSHVSGKKYRYTMMVIQNFGDRDIDTFRYAQLYKMLLDVEGIHSPAFTMHLEAVPGRYWDIGTLAGCAPSLCFDPTFDYGFFVQDPNPNLILYRGNFVFASRQLEDPTDPRKGASLPKFVREDPISMLSAGVYLDHDDSEGKFYLYNPVGKLFYGFDGKNSIFFKTTIPEVFDYLVKTEEETEINLDSAWYNTKTRHLWMFADWRTWKCSWMVEDKKFSNCTGPLGPRPKGWPRRIDAVLSHSSWPDGSLFLSGAFWWWVPKSADYERRQYNVSLVFGYKGQEGGNPLWINADSKCDFLPRYALMNTSFVWSFLDKHHRPLGYNITFIEEEHRVVKPEGLTSILMAMIFIVIALSVAAGLWVMARSMHKIRSRMSPNREISAKSVRRHV